MKPDFQKLLDEARNLPEPDRADLAARLIDSLDQSVDDDAIEQWDQEIARRVKDLNEGAAAVPWPELRARLLGGINDSSAA